jgi:hypothetical protein
MKITLPFVLFFLSFDLSAIAQHIAVAADKENVLYVGVENPLTIAAENCPCNKMVVKSNTGTLTGAGCSYIFKSNQVGSADFTVYRKNGRLLKKIETSVFRVKNLPLPVFKIGPSVDGMMAPKLAVQEYVRADLDGFDIDARFQVTSFNVSIYSYDTCKIQHFKNTGNKISDELRTAFSLLKDNDSIIFNEIIAVGPDGQNQKLAPLYLTIRH